MHVTNHNTQPQLQEKGCACAGCGRAHVPHKHFPIPCQTKFPDTRLDQLIMKEATSCNYGAERVEMPCARHIYHIKLSMVCAAASFCTSWDYVRQHSKITKLHLRCATKGLDSTPNMVSCSVGKVQKVALRLAKYKVAVENSQRYVAALGFHISQTHS